jgi:hypothetical protein
MKYLPLTTLAATLAFASASAFADQANSSFLFQSNNGADGAGTIEVEETMSIQSGFAIPWRLPFSYNSVHIGNPDLVEALPGPTDRDIIVTGKKAGVTNLLFLDTQNVVANLNVVIRTEKGPKGIVHMHTRPGNVHAFFAYECIPGCVKIEDKNEGTERVPTIVAPVIVQTGSPTNIIPK